MLDFFHNFFLLGIIRSVVYYEIYLSLASSFRSSFKLNLLLLSFYKYSLLLFPLVCNTYVQATLIDLRKICSTLVSHLITFHFSFMIIYCLRSLLLSFKNHISLAFNHLLLYLFIVMHDLLLYIIAGMTTFVTTSVIICSGITFHPHHAVNPTSFSHIFVNFTINSTDWYFLLSSLNI